MYYPYLRAKREEIFSLLEINPNVYGNTIPIIEPVGVDELNVKRIKKLIDRNINFIFILNPQVNQLNFNDVVETYVNNLFEEYNNYSIAYIITNNSSEDEILRFVELDLPKTLIHKFTFPNVDFINNLIVDRHIFQERKVSQNYINSIFSPHKIKLIDGFNKLARNADYAPNSFFSSLHFTYLQENLVGVGDYLIQGDNFSSTGGAASAVAIHLSTVNNNQIYVNHFVSDNVHGQTRTSEKFLEALDKLIEFVDENDPYETSGIRNYREMHIQRHSPGLAVNKRFALKNHIELSNII
ncbi:MAG: sce7725 family protein [Flavobacterium nitrogenifigens]|uniref:sce7725 family protein n=1 Tax=Flavobacterium nitrogenifigens TaxID=1617283 RepID=UPI0028070F89|nr:sce7725 family protein [Flavobacterium nitrogenifigens]MDQ8014876.1 sce7725 family protein [Flavobacterium nitrogenifigens]